METKTYKQAEWLHDDIKYLKAWNDILRLAETKDRTVRRGGHKVQLSAGVAYVSKKALSKKWNWHHESVDLFLERLQLEGLIAVECRKGGKTEVRILEKVQLTKDDESLLSNAVKAPVRPASEFPVLRKPDVNVVAEERVARDETRLGDRLGANLGARFMQETNLGANLGDRLGARFMQNQPNFAEKKGGLTGGLDSLSSLASDSSAESTREMGVQGEEGSFLDMNLPEGPLPELPPERRKPFKKPTVDEVRAFCEKRGNNIDPEEFWYYYESRGWRIGKNDTPMKSWQACIGTWERQRAKGYDKQGVKKLQHEAFQTAKSARSFANFDQRDTNYDELIRQLQGEA